MINSVRSQPPCELENRQDMDRRPEGLHYDCSRDGCFSADLQVCRADRQVCLSRRGYRDSR